MSWKQLGTPKAQGGMGFRGLHCFNKSLLAKQCWGLWENMDSLVAQIMKAKYYPNCSVLEAKLGNKPSFAWPSIINLGDLVKKGLIWRIGNGNNVRILGDKWLPISTTYKIQSPTTILHKEAKVNELIDPDLHWWNVSLLKQIFNDEEIKAIQSIPISLTNQPDV